MIKHNDFPRLIIFKRRQLSKSTLTLLNGRQQMLVCEENLMGEIYKFYKSYDGNPEDQLQSQITESYEEQFQAENLPESQVTQENSQNFIVEEGNINNQDNNYNYPSDVNYHDDNYNNNNIHNDDEHHHRLTDSNFSNQYN